MPEPRNTDDGSVFFCDGVLRKLALHKLVQCVSQTRTFLLRARKSAIVLCFLFTQSSGEQSIRPINQLRMILERWRPSDQFLVDGVANFYRRDFDVQWFWFCVESGPGNKEKTLVVVDIAPIARSTFGAFAVSHANGGLLVGGVTAPVGFPTNAAWSVFGNSTEAVDSDSLSLREVADGGLVGMGNMD